MQDHEQACVSVSVTTRRQRKHEIDGKDYWFVSVPEFERMVRMGEMLEYTYVNGNAYGTTKKSVEEARAKREKCNFGRGYNRTMRFVHFVRMLH